MENIDFRKGFEKTAFVGKAFRAVKKLFTLNHAIDSKQLVAIGNKIDNLPPVKVDMNSDQLRAIGDKIDNLPKFKLEHSLKADQMKTFNELGENAKKLPKITSSHLIAAPLLAGLGIGAGVEGAKAIKDKIKEGSKPSSNINTNFSTYV